MNITAKKELILKFVYSRLFLLAIILIGVTALFSLIFFPYLGFVTHDYRIGDVAERDVKAPQDFFIEDKEATQRKKNEAVKNVLTVYDHDSLLSEKIKTKVSMAFSEIRAIYTSESSLEKNNRILKNSELPTGNSQEPNQKSNQKSNLKFGKPQQKPVNNILIHKEPFEKKIGFAISTGAFKLLANEAFSPEIAKLIEKILKSIMQNGVVANKELLLREGEKGIVLRNVGTKNETIVYNLNQFYGLDQAKNMVKIASQPFFNDKKYVIRNLVIDFVQQLIVPNISLNRNETEERKRLAPLNVKPALYKIKSGEMVLREGERVTEMQLLKLNEIKHLIKKEKIVTRSIGAALLFLCLVLTCYIIHFGNEEQNRPDYDKNILVMAITLVVFLFIAKISASFSEISQLNQALIPQSAIPFGIPLATAPMIICLFMGLRLAFPFALVMAVCTGLIFNNRFEVFYYFLINGTMAAYWMQHCRERKAFINAGIRLAILNEILAIAINIYAGEFSIVRLPWDMGFALMGGILSGVITAGLAPVVEMVFGYTTDIKLLESANLDMPILRRLMIEAPGTYHHSVIVGSLVEAAAKEINANSLLAKVSGYYHDIGKIKKPIYFIENQMNGKNKHDKLAPSMSSLILINHIKGGVEIAKENKLGHVIIDVIRQHHGTSLINYFYNKAIQLKGEDAIKIEDFRYPGPKPQTREAGLVMLGDVVEAASRTLENPTPARIQGLVQNLINNIFSDGQLDDCELTLKDLHNIARSFTKILTGIHHHRIEYADSPASATNKTNGKGKDGSPDKQPAKPKSDLYTEDQTKSASHLKRLGQS